MLTVLIATSPFDESGTRYWGTRTAALQHPTQDSIAILRAAETILAGIFRDSKVYKKGGVIVSGIVPRESCSTTLSIFPGEEPVANERKVKLMQAMDAVNQRYGRGAVYLAFENAESWKPNLERLSPRYTKGKQAHSRAFLPRAQF